jgi:hypothetical protein
METQRSKKGRGNELLCRLSGFSGAASRDLRRFRARVQTIIFFAIKLSARSSSKENAGFNGHRLNIISINNRNGESPSRVSTG